jgi:hypothetical protein
MIRTIWIRDKGKEKTTPPEPMRFPSYITPEDIQLLIHETFPQNQVDGNKIAIGFIDFAKRYYPLSMLTIHPEIFARGVYSIVYQGDSQRIDSVGSGEICEEEEEDKENDEEGEEEMEETDVESSQEQQSSKLSSPPLPLRFLDGYLRIVCEEIKSRTGLDANKISVYLQSLSQFSSTNDLITKPRFLSSMVFALHQPDHQTHPHSSTAPPIAAEVSTIFEEIFDVFVAHRSHTSSTTNDEDEEATAMDITRLCRFLALFSGGQPNENIKILYHLFDFDCDGLLSSSDLYHCFLELLIVLSQLYRPLLDITKVFPLETIATALAQFAMLRGQSLKWENEYPSSGEECEGSDGRLRVNSSGEGVLSLPQFFQWYAHTEHLLYLPSQRSRSQVPSSSSLAGSLTSYQHLSAVKRLLPFHPVTCATLKLSLQHYSERSQASFISTTGVFSSLILSFRIHQTDIFALHLSESMTLPHPLGSLETIVRHIFDLHDPLHSECVAIEDIFASLSLLLNASWKDRLLCYSQLSPSGPPQYQLHLTEPETALDLLLTEITMIDYLVSVLKTLSLFAPPPAEVEEGDDDDERLLHQSTQMIRHALSTGLIPSQPHGLITLNDFADWLESQIDVGDTLDDVSPVLSNLQSRDEPRFLPLHSDLPLTRVSGLISADLKEVKERLGLVGFTAEDFMDLLGESADAGLVTLSSWLHIVELLNQLASTTSPSSQSSDLATNLFESLIDLTFSSSLSPSSSSRYNEEGGGALEYHILLSSLIMFCDSPVEDKIAVIFTVLSETIRGGVEGQAKEEEDSKRVTSTTLLFLLQCVLTVLSLTSPTVSELLLKTQQTTEVIARETLRYGVGRLEKPLADSVSSFGMDDFCCLLWAMLEAEEEGRR